MKIFYDEKGKFFTDHVTKVTLPVIIQTVRHTIKGNVHLRPEERLIDRLSSEEQFLAVTDAVIVSEKGEELYVAGFFTINLDHTVWIMPCEDVTKKPDYLGAS